MPRHSVLPRLTYRWVTAADLPTLVDHRHRMWTDIGTRTEGQISAHDPRYRRWARSRLQSRELVGVVAEVDRMPVASGLLWYRPEQPLPAIGPMTIPYILSMYTDPGWRGRGVATRIVRMLVEECRAQGHPTVILHASKFGRRVYRRVGFDRSWEMRYWVDRRLRPRVPSPTRGRKRESKKGLERAR